MGDYAVRSIASRTDFRNLAGLQQYGTPLHFFKEKEEKCFMNFQISINVLSLDIT